MKALSLTRPWTELIVTGVKDVENRSWPTKHRGWLVIHAAKSWDQAAIDTLNELGGDDGMLTPEDYAALDSCAMHRDAPTGYVGIVRVTDCHKWDDMACIDPRCEAVTSPCSPWAFDGSWHFRVETPIRFPEPIPGPGRLGMFDAPLEAARVAERLIAERAVPSGDA